MYHNNVVDTSIYLKIQNGVLHLTDLELYIK